MPQHIYFDHFDVLPDHFLDALQEFNSALGAFRVRVKPGAANVLQVPAGPGNDQVAIAVEGKYRWVTSNVERSDIGGAARTLDLYVTAAENVIVNAMPQVDSTDHSFALALVEHNAVAPATALKRKVAEVTWDGAKFTRVDQLVGGVSVPTMETHEGDTTNVHGFADTSKVPVATESGLRIVRGWVAANQVSGSYVLEGAGFTVTRPATGQYAVDFAVDYSDVPAVVATCTQAGSFAVVSGAALTAGGFTVLIADHLGSSLNNGFTFIAAGPA